jgi:phosphoribosylanthranilate isomerase
MEKGGARSEAAVADLWEKAGRLVREGFQLFLAGGLSPGNVRQAVERVRPFGVDVSSGVERDPGVKDQEAVQRFIEEARGCTQAKE